MFRDETGPINAVFIDYHQPIFSWLIHTYSSRLRANQLERPLQLRKTAFFEKISRNSLIEGEEAWKICYSYAERLEQELSTILRRHSAFFWMHQFRRIGVDLLDDIGPKTDANTLGLVRRILDIAISKYGDLNRDNEALTFLKTLNQKEADRSRDQSAQLSGCGS
jgi:hypothetical protein